MGFRSLFENNVCHSKQMMLIKTMKLRIFFLCHGMCNENDSKFENYLSIQQPVLVLACANIIICALFVEIKESYCEI